MCLSSHPLTRRLHIEQQCSQWQRSNKGWHTSSRPHLMNLLKKGNLTQNRISVSARNKKLDFPAPCTEAAIGNCFYRHRHRHFLRHTQTLPQAIGNCFNRHFLSCFIRSGGSSAPACHSRHFNLSSFRSNWRKKRSDESPSVGELVNHRSQFLQSHYNPNFLTWVRMSRWPNIAILVLK